MLDVLIKTKHGHVALSSDQIISITDREGGTCLIIYQSIGQPAAVDSTQPAAEVFQTVRDVQHFPGYSDPRRDTIPASLYNALECYSKERLEWIAEFLRHPPTAIQVIHDARRLFEREP